MGREQRADAGGTDSRAQARRDPGARSAEGGGTRGTKWTIVRCKSCETPYSARRIDGEIRLPTADGRCQCGSDSFVDLADRLHPRMRPPSDESGPR